MTDSPVTDPPVHGAIKIPLSPPLAKGGRGVCPDAGREREERVSGGSSTEPQTAIETVNVALGGGTVCFERNRALLRGSGPVALLTAPAEVILKRVGRSTARPLLAVPDAPAKIRSLLARRMRDYRRYRLRVDTSELTPAGSAEAVFHAIEEAGRRSEATRARDMATRRGGTCR